MLRLLQPYYGIAGLFCRCSNNSTSGLGWQACCPLRFASDTSAASECSKRTGAGKGARSGAGFVDHFFPDAFGLEDDLDEFARGAFPRSEEHTSELQSRRDLV